jgi:hypothetical protein
MFSYSYSFFQKMSDISITSITKLEDRVMDTVTRYIHVAKTDAEMNHPWELIFKGDDFSDIANLEEDDMLRFRTGHQALMLALRLQNMTPTTAIVVDPELDYENEREPDDEELHEIEREKELVDA